MPHDAVMTLRRQETMKPFHLVLIPALLTLALACKDKNKQAAQEPVAPEPTPTEPAAPPAAKSAPFASADEAGAALVVLVDKLVAAITAAGDDCAKIGVNLQTLTPDFKETRARSAVIESDPVMKKEFEDKFAETLQGKFTVVLPAIEKCKDDPGVQTFFNAMD